MSWWANKLNGTAQPVPAPQYYQPVTPAPQQGIAPIPSHLAPPGAQQHYTQQQVPPGYKPQTFSEALAMGDRLVEAGVTNARATSATRAGEVHNCPECGSGSYFDRSTLSARGAGAGGTILTSGGARVSAAPLCMDCGYRGTSIPQQYGELHDALLVDDEALVG